MSDTVLHNKKLVTLSYAVAHRQSLRLLGRKFVLTNGCFDLLHPGHIHYLQQAAKLGDELWVALNSKKSIQELKGPSRPIFDDTHRAYMLAALESVSGIIIFDDIRLTKEIIALEPDIYVKANDYTLETLNAEERLALEKSHTQIHFLPFLQGLSTTSLIEKIKTQP